MPSREIVGFIGLGKMGGPVAGHIQRAGYRLPVCDVRAEAGAPFGAAGAQAIAEGLSLGVKAGLDVRVVWAAVRRGLIGRMQVLHEQVPRSVFPGTYEPATFSLTLLRKDVGLATALGRQLDVPLPVTGLVEQILIEALNQRWANGAGYAVPFTL